jgi:pimeloyl-ACP methyl ester carboxylesterase
VKKVITSAWLGVPMSHLTQQTLLSHRVMTDIETTYRVTASYATITTPTLLLWGNHDTRVTPLARAREIAQEIPDAELVVLDGGHLMLYTNTDAAVAAISAFINKKESI